MGGVNGPIAAMDVGARGMSTGQRDVIARQLQEAQARSPLILQIKPGADGKPVAVAYKVEGGNKSELRISEALKGVQAQAAPDKFIMDKTIFESAMKSIEGEIAALKLDKTPPKPAPGQTQSGWLDQSVNSNINQSIELLKSMGIPYSMGYKGSLEGASALDCSGFASSLMRKVGANLDTSTGKHVSQTPSGTAADLVEAGRRNGGAISVAEFSRNPRPGCLIGLSTGAPHGSGRPNSVDHVAVSFLDNKDQKMKVAEFVGGKDGKGGLRVTELNDNLNKYEKKGAGIFIAGGPEAFCNKSALASVEQQKKVASAEEAQAVEVAEAEASESPESGSMGMS